MLQDLPLGMDVGLAMSHLPLYLSHRPPMSAHARRTPGEHINLAIRRAVHYQSEVLCWTPAEIATALDISVRTVQCILERRNIVVELVHEPRHEGRARILGPEPRKVCHSSRHPAGVCKQHLTPAVHP